MAKCIQYLYLKIIIVCVSVLLLTDVHAAPRSELSVTLKPFKRMEGTLFVCLYSSKDVFLGNPKYVVKTPVKAGTIKVKFKKIPYGYYAVTTYQDLNDNKIMDVFFSIPQEPWGLSKDFYPTLGAPKFENCKFVINSSNVNINIRMR